MSRRPSPTSHHYQPSNSPTSRKFDADASIALIGIRGTGMSTLAVMASSALGFTLVDSDHHFYKATALSRAAYKSNYGVAKYRQEELRLMRSMLVENPTKAVIVCGPGVVEGTGQAWLAEYAQSHPIIYVMRDVEEIGKHLRVWDTDTISRLARLSGPTHRTLSSFEFYNLSDPCPIEHGHSPRRGQESPRSLALKQLEFDFVQLLHGITRRTAPHEAHHSLSLLPPESRVFTYALSLPISIPASVSCRLGADDTAADAVELVVSLSEMAESFTMFDHSAAKYLTRQFWMAKRILRLPIIFHVQLENIKVKDRLGYESNYFEILHHGLRLAPEYLSVDIRCDDQKIRDLIAAKGCTKIIGHFFEHTPTVQGWDHPDRKDKIRRANELGCDLVRLCQEATSVDDNFLVQNLIQDVRNSGSYSIPLIAYNTGRLGRTSCFLNAILSPITHPLLRSIAPECAPPSLMTIREAQNALYSSFIMDKVYFGIYGANVAQSFSPAMHNAAFNFYGMPHDYRIFQYQNLSYLQQLVSDPRFGGASITAPYKRAVIPLVDRISKEAQAIGAVNTLIPLRSKDSNALFVRNRAGPAIALYGDNTDWIGIHVCIRLNLSPINAVRCRTTALIHGAGGMARAAIYALIRLGVRTVFVYNRTLQNAVELAAHFQNWPLQEARGRRGNLHDDESQNASEIEIADSTPHNLIVRVISSKNDVWPADVDHPTIIVSCIATQDVDGKSTVDTSLPIGWLASPTGGVAIELGYTPLNTPLIQQVREMKDSGWIAIDGLQVLPEQGVLQFELFTGRKPPRGLMRREVLRAYRDRAQNAVAPVVVHSLSAT
ncbi:type I 3-dehydroquinase-domain-containing protein [Dactylonectria estremocensis]|uniref:Type I 3-dehydroquinase-domain-containing protein n=1 Tax=Dactylonectria estremocensis TaxID=1079267 RepID=A0A9P9J538_9HYPO|nr:type I 3-dehydroquinase-domain-containing protein [Dactylonectria estremocensis]